MKKYFLLLAMCIATILSTNGQTSVWDGSHTTWTQGDGTQANPYLIENAAHLAHLAYVVNNGIDASEHTSMYGTSYYIVGTDTYWKLTVDIDLNGNEDFQWAPIGISSSYYYEYYAFGGNFDANGHTVSNLYINTTTLGGIGLFGCTNGASIKGVGIIGNSSITRGRSAKYAYAGGIIGYSINTIVDNCYNTGAVNATHNSSTSSFYYSYAGGIVGYIDDNTTISNCYNTGAINATASYPYPAAYAFSGGIVGYVKFDAMISNCYNTGAVTTTAIADNNSNFSAYSYSGGIIGYVGHGATISNCYNIGIINAVADTNVPYSYSGGIVGFTSGVIIVTNCYNTGAITAVSVRNGTTRSYSGGIVGYFAYSYNSSTINNCYNVGTVSSSYEQGGISGHKDWDSEVAITNSYYLDTCGENIPPAFRGGESKTEADMKAAGFVSLLNSGTNANLAFLQDVTPFVNNGYPVLSGFEIQTLPATNINKDNATLKGYIKQGSVTLSSKGFQYKKMTDTDYAFVAAPSSNDTLSYNFTGLQPNTTYQFRTFAINTEGDNAFGDEMTFTTTSFNTNSDGEFLIEGVEDLILLATLVNGGNSFSGQTFKLEDDITLPATPNNVISIGNYETNSPFSGTFNGNGKLIYNVYIDEPDMPYQGFFGYTQDAYLYEVGLVNITVNGGDYTGGMVGYAENTMITDMYVSGGSLFALSYCGGLVGYQTAGVNSIISGCYNNACTVTGNDYVGGLLGYSNEGTVRNSYVATLITGLGEGVGAVIGGAKDVLNYNCYFNEDITGQLLAIGVLRSSSSEGGMSSDDIRMQTFVNALNEGLVTPVWKPDYETPINNGFPILMWQANAGLPTGIDDVETGHAPSLQVYPNLAKDYLFIQSTHLVERVEIYNQSGVCVLINDNPTEQLNLSGLVSGFYLVRVYVDGIPVTRKIVISI